MQTLEQLTDASKSAWGTISQWIEHARNHCDVIKKINLVQNVSFSPCKCPLLLQWALSFMKLAAF